MEILLGSIIVLFFIMLFYYAFKHDMHVKWFKSLKPSDEVSVTIYSEYCNCSRNATVTKSIDEDNLIEAKMDEQTLAKCKNCANFKSINDKGEITCWYQVTKFTKEDVYKIKIKK